MTVDHLINFAINLVTSLGLVFAGAGFWAWLTRRGDRKSANTQLLLGLAHDRIVSSGMVFLQRGWVTKDEYDDFIKYLYEPYSKFGGNGLAEKVKEDVSRLPFYPPGTDKIRES